MSDLITIATYTNSTEATLAKNDLIASGIKAVLLGEEGNALWHTISEMSMIKLQVAQEDAARAAEMIKSPPKFSGSDEELAAEAENAEHEEEDD